jgi:polyhydroxyalkanoate synthesis regulator phasin
VSQKKTKQKKTFFSASMSAIDSANPPPPDQLPADTLFSKYRRRNGVKKAWDGRTDLSPEEAWLLDVDEFDMYYRGVATIDLARAKQLTQLRRRVHNRDAARKSRERKAREFEALKRQVRDLENEVKELQARNASLQATVLMTKAEP